MFTTTTTTTNTTVTTATTTTTTTATTRTKRISEGRRTNNITELTSFKTLSPAQASMCYVYIMLFILVCVLCLYSVVHPPVSPDQALAMQDAFENIFEELNDGMPLHDLVDGTKQNKLLTCLQQNVYAMLMKVFHACKCLCCGLL